ncbi:MAG: glycosyltransferase [Thermoanaerobaculales bacterium]
MTSLPTDGKREATIAHLINGENIGGIERLVMTLCRLHRRVQPKMVCLMDGAMRRATNPVPDLVPMARRLDLTAAVRVARYVREQGVDLLVAHTLRANLVGAVAARLARVPVVATIHSPIARDTEERWRNFRNARLQKLLIRWTDAYVTVSDGLRNEIVSKGVPPSRVTVVRNGVDADRYDAGDGAAFRRSLPGVEDSTPLVGTLALLRPRKGIEFLLRAAPVILRECPSCKFVVAGQAERASYAARLSHLCRELGIADRVFFTGHHEDVSSLLATLDVFVLPSLFGEGLPLVVLEAMAARRAVVATDTEGNREIIGPGVTGCLVPPGDPQKLAHTVAALLADPVCRREMGDAAGVAVRQRFSAARMTAEAEAAYLQVLAERRSR